MIKSISILLIITLGFSISFNAQESQDIVAGKWENGTYDKFNVTKGMQSKYYDEKVQISKDNNGKVLYVKIANMYKYLPVKSPGTEFVISFAKSEDEQLYFTENSIVLYDIDKRDGSVEFVTFVLNNKLKSVKKTIAEIDAFRLQKITSAVAAQDEKAEAAKLHKEKYSVLNKTLSNIEIQLISEDQKVDCGSEFQVGYIVHTTEGETFKSQNLGGDAYYSEYSVTVQGAKGTSLYDSEGYLNGFKIYKVFPYCEGLIDKTVIVKITAKDLGSVSDKLVVRTSCIPDPAIIAAKEKAQKEKEEAEKRRIENEKLLAEKRKKEASESKSQNKTNTSTSSASSSNQKFKNLGEIDYFLNPDTISFDNTGTSKHLAGLKTKNGVVVLNAEFGDIQSDGKEFGEAGYSLTEYRYVSGKLKKYKTGEVKIYDWAKGYGLEYNTFVKCGTGYMASGARLVYIFNEDLTVKQAFRKPDNMYIVKAVPVIGTDEIALLTTDKKCAFQIHLYDLENRKYYPSSNSTFAWNNKDESRYIDFINQAIINTGDGNLLCSVNKGDEQFYFKLSLENIRLDQPPTLWQTTFEHMLYFLEEDGLGLVSGYARRNNDTGMDRFTLNTNATTKEEFRKVLNYKGLKNVNDHLDEPYSFNKLSNGNYVYYGRGSNNYGEDGMHFIGVTVLYNKDFRVISQVKIQSKFDKILGELQWDENYYAIRDYDPKDNNKSYFRYYGESEFATKGGLYAGKASNYNKNVLDFAKYNLQETCEYVEGSKENELIYISSTSVIAVNIMKTAESELKFKLREKEETYSSSEESEPDDEEVNTTTTTSSTNETWVKIKNDGDNRLYLMNESGTVTTISSGKTSSFKCRNDVYYADEDSSGNHVKKGARVYKADSGCGKTIEVE